MKRPLSAALLLVLAVPLPAWADPPQLEIPAEIKAQPGAWVVVAPKTTATAVLYVGLDGLSAFPSSELKDPRKLVVAAPTSPGRWRFVAVGTLKDELAETAFVIVVGDVPPGPTPPGPTPPGPTPPTPGPVQGMRVLVVYESADATKLPAGQQGVLYAKAVRDYLNAHTPLGPDGKTHEWGIFDKDADLSGYGKPLADMMARPRKAVPWVVIADGAGKVAFEGPLPAGVDEMIALLKKYGG